MHVHLYLPELLHCLVALRLVKVQCLKLVDEHTHCFGCFPYTYTNMPIQYIACNLVVTAVVPSGGPVTCKECSFTGCWKAIAMMSCSSQSLSKNCSLVGVVRAWLRGCSSLSFRHSQPDVSSNENRLIWHSEINFIQSPLKANGENRFGGEGRGLQRGNYSAQCSHMVLHIHIPVLV